MASALQGALLEDEICFAYKAVLSENLPPRILQHLDQLALIFLLGFVWLRHIVMAMIIFTAMIVKAKTTIMAMTIEPYESIAYTEIAPRT